MFDDVLVPFERWELVVAVKLFGLSTLHYSDCRRCRQTMATQQLAALVQLVRFQYHANYLVVVIAAVMFAPELDRKLLVDLCFHYLSFVLMLHGGIYTLNAIADKASDSRHPIKRSRPLPSGRISCEQACCIMLFFWISSFVLIWRAGCPLSIFSVYASCVIVNLVYSFWLRATPLRPLIGITASLRAHLGGLLAGVTTLPWGFYLGAFCFMSAVQCLKISGDQGRGFKPSALFRLLVCGTFLSFGVGRWSNRGQLAFSMRP